MPTVYVYSPVGGIITGRENYCGYPCDREPCTGDHGTHSTCKGWSSPVDIDAQNGEELFLYVNYPTIKSIRTFIEYECCCNSQNEYGRAIVVELYAKANAVCYIGSVLFGHVYNPQVEHGHVYNLDSRSKRLGYAPTGSYSCGGFTCYSGSHVHMERLGGQTVAPCCCEGTTKGSTPIYKFIYSDIWCT